jgi:putative SOS response-associated peptidase YedK
MQLTVSGDRARGFEKFAHRARILGRMCGRYVVARTLSGQMPDLLGQLPGWPADFENFNIAPTTAVPVVVESLNPASGEIERHVDGVHWGFVASWKKSITDRPQPINARIETIASNGMFRSAFRYRRCIVPATGYYEWHVGTDGVKHPYFIHAPHGLALAAIYEDWTGGGDSAFRSMAIITRAAVGPAAELHDRLPVMLAPDAYGDWLGSDFASADDALDLLMTSSTPLADTLQFHAVDNRVGNVRSNDPQLIAPLV